MRGVRSSTSPRRPPRSSTLTCDFLDHRGDGETAAWHVAELAGPLVVPSEPEPGADVRSPALPYGTVPGGEHVAVGEDGFDAATVGAWARRADEVVVTPWHGVLIPKQEEQ